jgi:hypothetical protein
VASGDFHAGRGKTAAVRADRRARERKLKIRLAAIRVATRKTRERGPMVRGKLAKAKTEILAASLLQAAKVDEVAAAKLDAKARAAIFSSCN